MASYYWTDHYGRRWKVCPCLQRWLPAYEKELLRRGLIHTCIDLYQTIGGAEASAGTHSKGGAFDSAQFSKEQIRVARQMGADATWHRRKSQGFDVDHAHGVLRGCPHNEPARYQIAAVDAGYNGLGAGGKKGKDDGPKPLSKRTWDEGIKWAAAQAAEPKPEPVVDPIQWKLWKITLPVGKNGKPTETASDIPHRPWYGRNVKDRRWLIFRAPVGGYHTPNSKYPRSELRELDGKGGLAKWSSRDPKNILTGEFKITETPGKKPHVVCAQIHDKNDDVMMVRLEGRHLFVESDGNDVGTLDANYRLGTEFTLKVVASKSGIHVTYNGRKTVRVGKVTSGNYFKAGCYTQANKSNGTGAGEVHIANLRIEH